MISKKPTRKATNSTLESVAKNIENLENSVKDTAFNPQKHNYEVRSKIAICFTGGFFILLSLVLIGGSLYNLIGSVEQVSVKDLMLTVSGIVGTPLGLVLGYYFKRMEN